LGSIIKLIWKHCHDEWLNRNTILHGNTLQTRNQARLHQVQYRIRSLYDLRHLCSLHARTHWYYPSLEVHFARDSDPRQLEHWLAINEGRILSYATNRQNHLRIDEYFPPITYSPDVTTFMLSSDFVSLRLRAIVINRLTHLLARQGSQQRDVIAGAVGCMRLR
jgi:hypothetical protein